MGPHSNDATPEGGRIASSSDVERTSIVAEEVIDGKYRLVRLIGRGAMGSVWEAQHVALGRRVAIKFVEAGSGDIAELVARFDTEARAAASVHSKYTVAIEHHGVTTSGRPYIVMEHLEGETLEERLRRGRLSLGATTKLLLDVARGLERAHEKGIVHRDLKPANVFIVPDPEEGIEIAKVLDFGIAKLEVASSAGHAETQVGTVLGTPSYMAPEQARGTRELDARADVWSLGVIAYECVTGRLPFEGRTTADLLVNVCTAPWALPSTYVSVPTEFDEWMSHMLAREPDDRYSSILKAATDLSAFAMGHSHLPSLRPASSTVPPGRSPSRQVLFGAVATVVALVVFVIGGMAVVRARADAAAAPAQSDRAMGDVPLPSKVALAASTKEEPNGMPADSVVSERELERLKSVESNAARPTRPEGRSTKMSAPVPSSSVLRRPYTPPPPPPAKKASDIAF